MSRRTERVGQAIRETVSTSIIRDLRDPRIKNVTVIRCEVSPDLCKVDVYVSVMGEERVQALSLQGLNSARGFLQSKIADRIKTKNTPIIQFKLEDLSTAIEAERILQNLRLERGDDVESDVDTNEPVLAEAEDNINSSLAQQFDDEGPTLDSTLSAADLLDADSDLKVSEATPTRPDSGEE